MYQNRYGRPWSAAPVAERRLFLTGANAAILLVVEAIERSVQVGAPAERLH